MRQLFDRLLSVIRSDPGVSACWPVALAVSVLGIAPSVAPAAEFEIIEIEEYPMPGGSWGGVNGGDGGSYAGYVSLLRPFRWDRGEPSSATDLTPIPPWAEATTSDAFGDIVVGSGAMFGGASTAVRWDGNGLSITEIASGLNLSYAESVWGTEAVGRGSGSNTSNYLHAFLWDLTDPTARGQIDLHPHHLANGSFRREFDIVFGVGSQGYDNDATHQCGNVTRYGLIDDQPVAERLPAVWQGAWDTFRALSSPSENDFTSAQAVWKGEAGGTTTPDRLVGDREFAICWPGPDFGDYVLLNPSWAGASRVDGVHKGVQAGWATLDPFDFSNIIPVLWTGTPESAFNLLDLLPDYTSGQITDIDHLRSNSLLKKLVITGYFWRRSDGNARPLVITLLVKDFWCGADLAGPWDVRGFQDVLAYLDLFAAGDPLADMAEPHGELGFFDLVAFLTLFAEPCP